MNSKSIWNDIFRVGVVASLTLFTLMIPLSLFMLSVSASLLLVTLIGKKITDNPRVFVAPPFTWTILAFLMVAVLSLIFSSYPTPIETWFGLKKLRYFAYYFLFFYGVYETREVRLPIIAFLVGCALASILAWAQYWFGEVPWVTFFNHDVMNSPYIDKIRAIGFMSHHRRFSMTIGLAIPIVFSLVIHLKQGWRYQLLYTLLLVLFCGAILWTHGRGVIIAIVASSLIVPWVKSWKLGLLSIISVILVGLILVVSIPKDIFWLAPRFFSTNAAVFNESFDEQMENPIATNSNEIRVVLWRVGIEAFLKHPLLGIGFGQFKHEREKIDLAIKGADKYPHSHPHSELLWIGVELGIIGLAIFLFFWLALLFRLTRAYRRIAGLTPSLKALLYMGIWAALFWLLAGLTDVALLNSENAAAFWFVIGLASYALFMKKRANEVAL